MSPLLRLIARTSLLLLLCAPAAVLAAAVGYYPNGQVQWEYLYQNGQVSEAKWYDELGRLSARTTFRDGRPVMNEGYRSDGTLEWQSRELAGGRQEVVRFGPGRRAEMRYETADGQPDGPSTLLYPDGRRRQLVTFRRGVPHGPAQTFFENGQVENDYAYQDGQLHGPFRIFSPEGQLLAESLYEHGQLR